MHVFADYVACKWRHSPFATLVVNKKNVSLVNRNKIGQGSLNAFNKQSETTKIFFVHNFGKCWPILKKLFHLWIQQKIIINNNVSRFHHTLTM